MTYLIAASATKADCLLAGLIFGVVLMLVGRGIIWAVCNLRDERTAREAERIVPHPHVSPAATTPAAQEAHHWSEQGDDLMDVAQAVGVDEKEADTARLAEEHMQPFIDKVRALPGHLRVVHEQGQPGAWS